VNGAPVFAAISPSPLASMMILPMNAYLPVLLSVITPAVIPE